MSMKFLTIHLIITLLCFSCKPANDRAEYLQLAKQTEQKSAAAYLKSAEKNKPRSSKNIAAAMGAYVRVHGKEKAIQLLSQLVATKTFFNPDVEPAQNPEFRKAAALIKEFSETHDLSFFNHYGKIYEVQLAGSMGSPLAIYTHLDTVAAIPENWKLPNGKRIDPFTLSRIDGKLYGRGAEDDKGSIASALVAMSHLAELPDNSRPNIRLFIETTEETGGGGFKYYMERHQIPSQNIVLDSRYPVVVAEKGYGTLSMYYALDKAKSSLRPTVVFFRGGMARNQIPETAAVKINGNDFEKIIAFLTANESKWQKDFGDQFSFEINEKESSLWLTCKGVSAHASAPQDGLNPVSRCLHIIHALTQSDLLADNAYTSAASTAVNLFGLNETGKKIDLNYSDSFMGPFTAATTFLQLKGNELELAVNLRAPRGRAISKTKARIDSALKKFQEQQGVPERWTIALEEPMTRDPNQPWIKELLTIFEEVTGKPGRPRAESGATTARQIPNAVNFGPAMPGEKYRGHTALEYKTEQNLEYDLQMFTEMMMRIPGLNEAQEADNL